MNFKFMPKKKNILIFVLMVILLTIGSIVYLVFKIKTFPVQKEETLSEKQLRELDALRKNAQPLTEEQMKQQARELEALGKKAKLLTQDQIQKQLDELNNLRQAQ
ncbi:MAG: hypothetical protein ABIG40_01140 [Parcubacteria group bacterium]